MTIRIARGSALGLLAVVVAQAASAEPGIMRSPFGKTADGQEVDLFVLTNANGMEAKITNYGGIVVGLTVPDRNGKLADVVLGFDALDGYLAGHPFFGALVGRYGNRIGKATFTLDGMTYTLPANSNGNTLHGGEKGFDKAVWRAQPDLGTDGPSLKLFHRSPDGDQGFPGNLDVTVIYTLTNQNELRIDYHARTDKPTVVALTHHSYFNLAGQGDGTILGHELRLAAERFTPVDSTLIPTGELRPVEGTPFDFRKPTTIGARIDQDDEQIKFGMGYDHNVVLDSPGPQPALAAEVVEPTTGRVMQVLTTEPGMQFYTGNFLDGTITGKGGKTYPKRSGFCLETQKFPDSPNKPMFPSCVLRPGEDYRSTTVYRFSTKP